MDGLQGLQSKIDNKRYQAVAKFLNEGSWMEKNRKSSKISLLKTATQYTSPKIHKGNNLHSLHKIYRSTFSIKQNKIQKNVDYNFATQKERKQKESFIDLSSEFFSCPHLDVNSSKIEQNFIRSSDIQSYKNFLPKNTSTPMTKLNNVNLNFKSRIFQAPMNKSQTKLNTRNPDYTNEYCNTLEQVPKIRKIIESNLENCDSNYLMINDNSFLKHNNNRFLLKNNVNNITESFHSAPNLTNLNISNVVDNCQKKIFHSFENNENQLQSFTSFNDSYSGIPCDFNETGLFENKGKYETKSFFGENNKVEDFSQIYNEDSFIFNPYRQNKSDQISYERSANNPTFYECTKLYNEDSQKTRYKRSQQFWKELESENSSSNNLKDFDEKFMLPSCWTHNERLCKRNCFRPSQNKTEIKISLQNKSKELNIKYPTQNRNKVRLQAEFKF